MLQVAMQLEYAHTPAGGLVTNSKSKLKLATGRANCCWASLATIAAYFAKAAFYFLLRLHGHRQIPETDIPVASGTLADLVPGYCGDSLSGGVYAWAAKSGAKEGTAAAYWTC
jgi:hypothetical protein